MDGWTDIYSTDSKKSVRLIRVHYITCYKIPTLAVQFLIKRDPLVAVVDA
jgi:hypothetical protein